MERLYFKTSSGIKNILGKDLITDRFIAIFELVKNSYDAQATRVDVIFLDDKTNPTIKIIDNGIGMSKNELIQKWLFLAYSEKKEGAENIETRAFVGSKGVGRLSCDSLGSSLILKTKKKGENVVNYLSVDWTKFEGVLDKKFEEIDVNYRYEIVDGSENVSFTELHLGGLRHIWNDSAVGKAKARLERLKNPFVENDDFNIFCKQSDNQSDQSSIVRNNISDVLKDKTISMTAVISDKIIISLIDRGKPIYTISKDNDTIFKGVNINITVNYLTASAKNNFKRKMGVETVNYGSVFVYKNNFRVNPYGDVNYDLFNLNVRKTQGYNRYIGTREMLGYISIHDKNNHFLESSSRNNGFINNIYMAELENFYLNEVHKPFEKYIRLVKWGEDYLTKEETHYNDVSSGSEAERFRQSLNKKNKYKIDFFMESLQFEEGDPTKQLDIILDGLTKPSEKKIIKSVVSKISNIRHDSERKDTLLIKKEKEIKQLKQQNENLIRLRTKESYAEQVSHHFTKLSDALSYSLEDLIQLKSNLKEKKDLTILDSAMNIIKKTELEMGMFRKILLKSDIDVRSSQRINFYEIIDWYFLDRNKMPGSLKIFNVLREPIYISNWFIYCNVLDFMMALENFYQNAKGHHAGFLEFLFEEDKIIISNDSTPIDSDIIDKIFDLGFTTKPSGTGIGMYQIKEFCKSNKLNITVKNDSSKVIFTINKE